MEHFSFCYYFTIQCQPKFKRMEFPLGKVPTQINSKSELAHAVTWRFYLPASADPPRDASFNMHEEFTGKRTLQGLAYLL